MNTTQVRDAMIGALAGRTAIGDVIEFDMESEHGNETTGSVLVSDGTTGALRMAHRVTIRVQPRPVNQASDEDRTPLGMLRKAQRIAESSATELEVLATTIQPGGTKDELVAVVRRLRGQG